MCDLLSFAHLQRCMNQQAQCSRPLSSKCMSSAIWTLVMVKWRGVCQLRTGKHTALSGHPEVNSLPIYIKANNRYQQFKMQKYRLSQMISWLTVVFVYTELRGVFFFLVHFLCFMVICSIGLFISGEIQWFLFSCTCYILCVLIDNIDYFIRIIEYWWT